MHVGLECVGCVAVEGDGGAVRCVLPLDARLGRDHGIDVHRRPWPTPPPHSQAGAANLDARSVADQAFLTKLEGLCFDKSKSLRACWQEELI